MIKAIFFDLDGTLADTIYDITDALNDMLTEFSFPLQTREDTLKNINYGALHLVKNSLPEECREDEELLLKALKSYKGHCLHHYDKKVRAYDGVAEALKALKARGIQLAVLTNKQDNLAQSLIRKLFGEGVFDVILGQADFPPKPDPTAARYLMDKFGVCPDEVALVGDSHIDMQTAKAAGVRAVGVAWGYRSAEVLKEYGAEMLVNTRDELVGIPDFNFISTEC